MRDRARGLRRRTLLKRVNDADGEAYLLKGQDTSELFFDNVRVPIENRLGEENQGFKSLTHQLAWERTIIGICAAASIEALLDETIQYTRDRKVFAQSVFDFQNTLGMEDGWIELLRCSLFAIFPDLELSAWRHAGHHAWRTRQRYR